MLPIPTFNKPSQGRQVAGGLRKYDVVVRLRYPACYIVGFCIGRGLDSASNWLPRIPMDTTLDTTNETSLLYFDRLYPLFFVSYKILTRHR
jgi:hypothetical protein